MSSTKIRYTKKFLFIAIGFLVPIALMGQSIEISTTSGNIGSALSNYTLSEITSLKVNGTLDATDFKIIRDNLSSCTEIDLSGVSSINKYEGYDGTWANPKISGGSASDRDGWYSYPLFELPTQAFSTYVNGRVTGWVSMKLNKVTLPTCIKTIGDDAFRKMYTLQEVLINENNNYFKSIDGVLYSKDGTQLRLYPFGRKDAYTLPVEVTAISTDGISDASFTSLTLLSSTPPTLETHSFTAKTVYVPEGSINAYKAHEHWKYYNIKETGDIKVTKGDYDDLNEGFTLVNDEFQGWITYKKSDASAKLMIRFQLKDKSWASTLTMQYADAFDGETETCSFDNEGVCWIPMTGTDAEKYLLLTSTKLGSMEYHIDIYNEEKTKSLYSEDGIFRIIEPVVVDIPQKITGSIDEQIPFTIKISNSGIFKGKEMSFEINAYGLPLESTSLFYIKSGQSQKINMSKVENGINVTEGTFNISLSDGDYSFAIQSTTATENASLNCYLLESDNAYFPYNKYPNDKMKIEISGKSTDKPIVEDTVIIVNNLRYKLLSETTASVVGPDVADASGTQGNDNDSWTVTDCVIPSTITYNSIAYQVKSIEDGAFSGATNMKTIILPEGLETIGYEAFYRCYGLKTLHIPASVTSIKVEEDEIFFSKLNIESIKVASDNKVYASLNGLLYNKSITTLLFCPYFEKNREVTLPEGVTTLRQYVFAYQDSLISVTLPESLKSIGNYAFYQCEGLVNIHFKSQQPPALAGENAFESSKLDHLIAYVPKGYKKAYTDWGIFRPENIIEEGETSATTFTIGLLKYTVIANNEVEISGVTDKTQEGYDIKPTVEYQGKTYTVTAVGDKAFYECTNLIRFQPERVKMALKTIGNEAFMGCSKLTNLLLNTGLEQIGESAFCECSSLQNLEIPASVSQIGDWAFNDCAKLANISVNSANKYFSSSNGVLFNKDKTTLLLYPNMQGNTNYIVPKSVTKIAASAFENCTNLPAIVLPENLKEIGGAAFYNCSKLTSIILPTNLSHIGGEAFGECKGIKTFTIPASVTSLGEYIFTKCESTLQEIHSKRSTPPDICKECGYGIFTAFGTPVTSCKLYVPKGSKAAYAKALGWKDFKYILEEGENPPLIPDTSEDEIILNTDSTYTDSDGNTGHFNGMIGNGEEGTAINKLTIKGSATSTTTNIIINKVTVGNGSTTTETTTSVTQNTNVVIELIGDNSLGKLVNDGIARLISLVEASLHNTVVVNNGIFTDETGLLTRIEGAAELDITAPSDQQITEETGVTLTASTKVNIDYNVSFIWEQLQPDGTWKAIGTPTVYTPTRSGLRAASTTITDKLTVKPKDAGKYRCIIQNKVGDVSSTLITQPAIVTVNSNVANITPQNHRRVTIDGQQLHFNITEPIEVRIINMNGIIIRELSLPAGDTIINDLEKGIYILQFKDGIKSKVRI